MVGRPDALRSDDNNRCLHCARSVGSSGLKRNPNDRAVADATKCAHRGTKVHLQPYGCVMVLGNFLVEQELLASRHDLLGRAPKNLAVGGECGDGA